MFSKFLHICFIALLVVVCNFAAHGQSADNTTSQVPDEKSRDTAPKGMREMIEKMRIAKEKKEYEEMIGRGDKALKLSDELETSLSKSQTFSEKDREKLAALEKLVKKIRTDLGGDDDKSDEETEKAEKPSSIVEGFKWLKNATVDLVGQLKKTTRFSISATAIQSSNVVLRLTRYLRFWK